ncbi:MAG: ABC transporter substrate-binding protein [Candidatus Limnocylindrales bacterium]
MGRPAVARILRRMRRRTRIALVALLVPVVATVLVAGCRPSASCGARTQHRLGSCSAPRPPLTRRPKAMPGSAAVTAQLFETLTTFDTDRELQPALAASWQVQDGGRRIVFQLRPDLSFSDGSPLRASDVVRSWLRLLDPAAPSPLVTPCSMSRAPTPTFRAPASRATSDSTPTMPRVPSPSR